MGVKTKKKIKKNVPHGRCYIQAGFGNLLITITDPSGGALCWASAGSLGFKGGKKGTPFAAQRAGQEVATKAMNMGMKSLEMYVSGPGGGRDSAIRAIAKGGLRVTLLKDTTPIPHNGCRPPKRRRV